VGEEAWRTIVRRDPVLRLPSIVFDRFRPWVAFGLVAGQGTPGAAPGGMDFEVSKRGHGPGRRLVALGTADQQIDLLNRLPQQPFVAALRASAPSPDRFR